MGCRHAARTGGACRADPAYARRPVASVRDKKARGGGPRDGAANASGYPRASGPGAPVDGTRATPATGRVPPERAWVWWAFTIAAVAVVFGPGVRGDWLWDDEVLVLARRITGSFDGLVRIWTGDGTPDYFPLTSTSFWLERRVFEGPLGHRVVNLALHALDACLVGAIALRVGVPRGRLVGLLFAVHPMVVSSVAWVSERKNTLSLCFALAALLAALPRGVGFPKRRAVVGLVACFALALLAKTQVVGLPFVVAGLWWLRARASGTERPTREMGVALAAMSVVALVLGLVTVHFQRASTQADAGDALTRIVRAADVIAFHAAHTLWPSPLAMVHARDAVSGHGASGWLALVALLGGAVTLAVRVVRRPDADASRALLVALVAYVAMLGPTLGLLDMAFMRFAFVAEHFGYAALPVALAVIVGALGRLPDRLALPLAGLATVALGAAASAHAGHFVSRRALWSHNVEVVPTAATALGNHALLLQEDGRPREALRAAREAVRLSPDDAELHCFLGVVLHQQLATSEARRALERSLALDPEQVRAHNNLASVLVHEGDVRGGIAHLRRALAIEPDYALGHLNLARLLASEGEMEEAERERARAIVLDAALREVPLVPEAADGGGR